MATDKSRSSMDENNADAEKPIDLEDTISGPSCKPHSSFSYRYSEKWSIVHTVLGYPPAGTLSIKPTSWLDGVRGVAAFEVYVFHSMGCWASIVAAWHADGDQQNVLQLPLLRTFFVSGPAAVSVFFALSGYVLTYKCLRWIRGDSKHQVYPAVASSMFRRGFRLYLPPITLTFFEMLATRFGYIPPLKFSFVPEPTFSAQLLDWLVETSRFINPVYNFLPAIQGINTPAKYDPVIWTIPLEFYGSFVCYTLLLLSVRIPSNRVRMLFVTAYSVFCMVLGSWNLFCFSAGMLIADFNLGQEEEVRLGAMRASSYRGIWMSLFGIAFYIAGFPTLVTTEAASNPMFGFEILRALIPSSLDMDDHSRYWWSISGVMLLLSMSQLPRLKAVFESNLCQYLGRISFSLYLIHEFCIVLFGMALQSFLMDLAGLAPRANTFLYWVICGIWFMIFTLPVFALAALVERWVDMPSVKFSKWLEGKCLRLVTLFAR